MSELEVEVVTNIVDETVEEIVVDRISVETTPPLIPLDKVRNYLHAHNVMSYVRTFCKLSASPLELLVRQEQKLHTPTLFNYVINPNTKVEYEIKNLVCQLNIVCHENTLRCKTRIEKGDLNFNTHFPYFIPRESKLVKLFITYLHNKHRHGSVTQTLTLYRQHAWTPKLRPIISNILSRCSVCQILRRKTATRPPPPALPEERVRYRRPFEVVGVDNTGSFEVRDTLEGKRYLTLFVCTTTRNVHIEVTTSLTTTDFLYALRRFTAYYGVPKIILSDNGKNFVGAQRSLAEAA